MRVLTSSRRSSGSPLLVFTRQFEDGRKQPSSNPLLRRERLDRMAVTCVGKSGALSYPARLTIGRFTLWLLRHNYAQTLLKGSCGVAWSDQRGVDVARAVRAAMTPAWLTLIQNCTHFCAQSFWSERLLDAGKPRLAHPLIYCVRVAIARHQQGLDCGIRGFHSL